MQLYLHFFPFIPDFEQRKTFFILYPKGILWLFFSPLQLLNAFSDLWGGERKDLEEGASGSLFSFYGEKIGHSVINQYNCTQFGKVLTPQEKKSRYSQEEWI